MRSSSLCGMRPLKTSDSVPLLTPDHSVCTATHGSPLPNGRWCSGVSRIQASPGPVTQKALGVGCSDGWFESELIPHSSKTGLLTYAITGCGNYSDSHLVIPI